LTASSRGVRPSTSGRAPPRAVPDPGPAPAPGRAVTPYQTCSDLARRC